MDVDSRLKWALVVSLFALFLKIVAFASPGWAIVGIHFPTDRNEEIREIEEGQFEISLQKEIGVVREGERLSVSLGLWYFVVCVRNVRSGAEWLEVSGYERKPICIHKTYESAMETARDMSRKNVIVHGTLKMIAGISKFGLLEFRTEATLGLLLTMVGLVSLFMYKRTGAQRRRLGLTACIAYLVAGILYWVAIGKITTDLVHLHDMVNIYYGGTVYGIHVPVPWCLAVGGFAATISFLVSLTLLFVLTKDREANIKGGPIYYTGSNIKDISTPPPYFAFPEEKIDLPPFPEVKDQSLEK